MTESGPLRLRAADEADLHVIGAMAQDAIVPLADMLYIRDEGRFVIVLNRFMWERNGETLAADPADADAAEPGETYFRVHGLLSVANVRSIQVRDIDQRQRDQLRSILTIGGGKDHVRIEFSGGGTIRLEVDGLACLLEDLGEPWPTRWQPRHDVGDEKDEAAFPDRP